MGGIQKEQNEGNPDHYFLQEGSWEHINLFVTSSDHTNQMSFSMWAIVSQKKKYKDRRSKSAIGFWIFSYDLL